MSKRVQYVTIWGLSKQNTNATRAQGVRHRPGHDGFQTIIQTFKGLDDTCTYGTVIGKRLISKAFMVDYSDFAFRISEIKKKIFKIFPISEILGTIFEVEITV